VDPGAVAGMDRCVIGRIELPVGRSGRGAARCSFKS
jgi:hypothetical protein